MLTTGVLSGVSRLLDIANSGLVITSMLICNYRRRVWRQRWKTYGVRMLLNDYTHTHTHTYTHTHTHTHIHTHTYTHTHTHTRTHTYAHTHSTFLGIYTRWHVVLRRLTNMAANIDHVMSYRSTTPPSLPVMASRDLAHSDLYHSFLCTMSLYCVALIWHRRHHIFGVRQHSARFWLELFGSDLRERLMANAVYHVTTTQRHQAELSGVAGVRFPVTTRDLN